MINNSNNFPEEECIKCWSSVPVTHQMLYFWDWWKKSPHKENIMAIRERGCWCRTPSMPRRGDHSGRSFELWSWSLTLLTEECCSSASKKRKPYFVVCYSGPCCIRVSIKYVFPTFQYAYRPQKRKRPEECSWAVFLEAAVLRDFPQLVKPHTVHPALNPSLPPCPAPTL